ncbi:hypothetical protein [Halapricum hydrolyticum]|uniref:Uncharacterized protein n=1 Tax=Halapricum hydrolyticum TaxID=2979991 RepID=A0AAE3IDE1_9EURY|nr:hypothetical protein [Halapricum hydrolyticum]MCU4719498.1 hypothetical protein [Halapricum hydrolyticum]MCU4728470.1 hypothetical protein [Halapricum hydrolyticum]
MSSSVGSRPEAQCDDRRARTGVAIAGASLLGLGDAPLASFEDARRAAGRIPDAERRAYEHDWHRLFGHGADVEGPWVFLNREIETPL